MYDDKNYQPIKIIFSVVAVLRRKIKDWFVQNQDNMSECVDMVIRGLLYQCASTIKNPTKRFGQVQSGPHRHLIEN